MARDIHEIKRIFSAVNVARELAYKLTRDGHADIEDVIQNDWRPIEITDERWFWLVSQASRLSIRGSEGDPNFEAIPGITDDEIDALWFVYARDAPRGKARSSDLFGAACALYNANLADDQRHGSRLGAKPFKSPDAFRIAYERYCEQPIFK